MAALRAIHSIAVATLYPSNKRACSVTKSSPTLPLGTSNKLRLQWTIFSYTSSILEQKLRPSVSPQVKLGELKAGNGGRSSGMIAGSAGSSVLRMGWLGDAELTSRGQQLAPGFWANLGEH